MWSGFSVVGPGNAHNFHVCQFNGSTHLCLFQGYQFHGYARGNGLVLNTDYDIVASVQARGDSVTIDQHEFRTLGESNSALVSVYRQEAADLSHMGVVDRQGWIMDSLFQEINMTDGTLVFEWSAAQHVDPAHSYVPPAASDIVGDGRSRFSPWDFFHINSIGKSRLTGNYIVSARHMSTIYYIDGRNGSVIWGLQAGGRSDFACEGFSFSFQHDAQIRAEDESSMVISFFDNASNGFNSTSERSTAKVVRLDYASRTARLATEMSYPHEDLRAPSQGNVQYLSNGNVFVGYGGWPRLSEHAADGQTVWAAHFGIEEGIVMSYRSSSAEWHAVPRHTRPSAVAYSARPGAATVMHMSWNGCTETSTWRLYGAARATDTMELVGSVARKGFETTYTSETHLGYVVAEAVDAAGVALRNSSAVRTFVPSTELETVCADEACPEE